MKLIEPIIEGYFFGIWKGSLVKNGHYYYCNSKHGSSIVNRTILYLFETTGWNFSIRNSLLMYVLCEMQQIVFITSNFLEAHLTFMTASGADPGDILYFNLIPITETFRLVIITGLKILKDQSYLSLINLFEGMVWFSIFIFITVYIILIIIISERQIKFFKTLDIILRLFFNNSSDEITNWKWNFQIKSQLKRLTFIVIIIISVQSISILTKSFTGLLCNTYFNIKYVPIIDILDDVIENDQLLIATEEEKLKRNLGNDFIDSRADHLLKKLYAFQNKFNIIFSNNQQITQTFIYNEIVLGKCVVICDSHAIRQFQVIFENWSNNYAVAQHKYMLDHSYLWMRKHLKISKKVNYLYKQIAESGLYQHLWQTEDILSKLQWNIDIGKESFKELKKDEREAINLDEINRNGLVIILAGQLISIIIIVCEILYLYFITAKNNLLIRSFKNLLDLSNLLKHEIFKTKQDNFDRESFAII